MEHSILIDLRKEFEEKVTKHKKGLDDFIDKSTLKDVMVQWVQNKKLKFETVVETLIRNSKIKVNSLKDEHLVRCKQKEKKKLRKKWK